MLTVTSSDHSKAAQDYLAVRVALRRCGQPPFNDSIHTASADPQTDKAAIEEAEKRIGAKEE